MLGRLLSGLLLLALAWAAGLALFIGKLPRTPARDTLSLADAVVVYTGDNARVSTAMALLSDGAGARLLISGVNPTTTKPQLAELWTGDPALFDCCVDLGPLARTTDGNARELEAWATKYGFRSLILVTSDYHMPRALVETRDELPAVKVTPYAVASDLLDPRGLPASRTDWKRISEEYTKYLAARVKTLFS
jgi:uncharacterized SAM-binding protein YcdF (DUF218 family)